MNKLLVGLMLGAICIWLSSVQAFSACPPFPSEAPWTWNIDSSCTYEGTEPAPGNVVVQPGATLTIGETAVLRIDLVNNNLTVKNGGGAKIMPGGQICQSSMTIYVDPGESIQAAVDQARPYDVVELNPGIHMLSSTVYLYQDKHHVIIRGAPSIKITNSTDGNVTDAHEGVSPTGFTFNTITQGDAGIPEVTEITCTPAASISSGVYFLIYNPSGEYYVWYTVDGVGSDPGIAGKTGIHVSLEANNSGSTVAGKTSIAVAGETLATMGSVSGFVTSPVSVIIEEVANNRINGIDIDGNYNTVEWIKIDGNEPDPDPGHGAGIVLYEPDLDGIYEASFNTIRYCDIHNEGYGVFIGGRNAENPTRGNIIESNRLHNNAKRGVSQADHIYGIIKKNYVYENQNSEGISVDTRSHFCEVFDNILIANRGGCGGIGIDENEGSRIYNNYIADHIAGFSQQSGITLNCNSGHVYNNEIFENTLVHNGFRWDDYREGYGMKLEANENYNSHDNIIRDNVFIDNAKGPWLEKPGCYNNTFTGNICNGVPCP